MADKSAIEWTDATWTPVRARNLATGKIGWHCEHATPGCQFCYSEGMNKRLGTGLPFKPGHRRAIELFLDEEMLLAPLRWKRPRMVFVCSMTDLFADFVPDEWVDRVFAVMALADWHTFQVLTKRSARARAYLTHPMTPARIAMAMARITAKGSIAEMARGREIVGWMTTGEAWPLPNVWLGVSAEDQARADERIPDLLATPAAVRFVSAEPLLGLIDFTRIGMPDPYRLHHLVRIGVVDALTGRAEWVDEAGGNATEYPHRADRLDWIIVGGESGPSARPFALDWAESIIDQCRAAGVACFVKQVGSRPARIVSQGLALLKPMGSKGGDPEAWPEHLRVREMPRAERVPA